MADESRGSDTVEALLRRARAGDGGAMEEAFGRVYDELRLLARRQRVRWDGDFTLNTTALLHEAYLKLAGAPAPEIRERGHFFALASRAMRQILCNYARDRRALKRGGAADPVTLDTRVDGAGDPGAEPEALIALDDALSRLEEAHPRAGRVVECRFFGGMTVEETAAALDVSSGTVKRHTNAIYKKLAVGSRREAVAKARGLGLLR